MPPKNEPKVAAELCKQEFERLCTMRRIEMDPENMSKFEATVFESRKATILRAMGRGELVVDKDGNPVFTPPGGKPITFHRATGATLMEQDGFGPNHDIARVTAVATELTKSTPGDLSKLDIGDFTLVGELTNFLLGR